MAAHADAAADALDDFSRGLEIREVFPTDKNALQPRLSVRDLQRTGKRFTKKTPKSRPLPTCRHAHRWPPPLKPPLPPPPPAAGGRSGAATVNLKPEGSPRAGDSDLSEGCARGRRTPSHAARRRRSTRVPSCAPTPRSALSRRREVAGPAARNVPSHSMVPLLAHGPTTLVPNERVPLATSW